MINISKKVLFVYLAQSQTAYYLKKTLEYDIQRRPQLGFQYMSAVLKNEGIESEILDQTIEHFSSEELVRKVNCGEYYFVGFYTAASLQGSVTHYIQEIKKNSKIPIVVGGPGFLKGEQYLMAGCDIVCNGEGEKTILEIVKYFKGDLPLEVVKGVSYLKDGRLITASPQTMIENLDELPFPRRDLVDMKFYRDFYIFNMKLPYTTIMTGRGCPCRCSYCTSHVVWRNKVRQRSPENVVSEIDYLVKKYGVKYLAFQDDIFGINERWTEKFCNMLIEREYDLNWMCILHPFSFKNDRNKYINLLRKAGCDTLSIGLQSAHPDTLKNIRRHPGEPGAVEDIVRIAKINQMLTFVSFILGLPGETEATIKTSMDYALKIKPNYVEFYSLTILEGSELEQLFDDKSKVCGLREDEIKDWCHRATRNFYTNPLVIMNNIAYIARHNFSWFFTMSRYLPHLFDVMGVK